MDLSACSLPLPLPLSAVDPFPPSSLSPLLSFEALLSVCSRATDRGALCEGSGGERTSDGRVDNVRTLSTGRLGAVVVGEGCGECLFC